jgi:hypothetical protein
MLWKPVVSPSEAMLWEACFGIKNGVPALSGPREETFFTKFMLHSVRAGGRDR